MPFVEHIDNLKTVKSQITFLQQTLCSGEQSPLDTTSQDGLFCILKGMSDTLQETTLTITKIQAHETLCANDSVNSR